MIFTNAVGISFVCAAGGNPCGFLFSGKRTLTKPRRTAHNETMPTKLVKTYEDALKDAQKRMIRAGVNTVNIVAAQARKNAQQNITRNFTTRNNFTVNSVRFTQCKPSVQKLSDIKSETGITEKAGYMARQETGGVKKAPGGANLIIPNTRARGGSNANKVQRRYHYDNVIKNTVRWSDRGGSRKARLVATAFIAAREKKFIRMNDAFFRVTNFRKGKRVSFKLQEILNLKHKTTYTPQNKWLEPAAESAAKNMQAIFNSQMDKV